MPRSSRALRRVLAGAVLVAVSGLSVSACASGPIAANTPKSEGAGYVSGDGQSTVFKVGSRPKAPAIAGTTLTGSTLSLTAYRGDVVVLNFWGSWCPPCRAEAPTLAALSAAYRARGVRFVGVDIRDSPATAEAFMRDHGIGYPSVNDPSGSVALAFRDTVPPSAIPTTLVIDRSGHIAARILGEAYYSTLNRILRAMTSSAASAADARR